MRDEEIEETKPLDRAHTPERLPLPAIGLSRQEMIEKRGYPDNTSVFLKRLIDNGGVKFELSGTPKRFFDRVRDAARTSFAKETSSFDAQEFLFGSPLLKYIKDKK
jgi:hypothetical protein